MREAVLHLSSGSRTVLDISSRHIAPSGQGLANRVYRSEDTSHGEPASKVPVQSEKSSWRLPQQWEPFERLRREMDPLFDDFTGGFFGRSLFDPMPFRRAEAAFRTMPAVDVAETDKGYEIKAELPGLDENCTHTKQRSL